MSQCPTRGRTPWRPAAWLSGAWLWAVLLVMAAGLLRCEGQDKPVGNNNYSFRPASRHFLTNTAQFKTLAANDYLDTCPFHLKGIVTLVDTNRSLLVLQDETGALAVHFDFQDRDIQEGQIISLAGSNCYPYVVSFPDYPYRPSGWEVRKSFEGPTDWREYYLSRMRGYLHPPVTGEYTFWVASDNSSELWLSQNDSPARARRIAFISPYGWASLHEWSKYTSQHSETVLLKAGVTYYIEALQEQTSGGDNLAVAWEGPELPQSVISNAYLSPWPKTAGQNDSATTNGMLREYWTNYSVGGLTGLSSSRPFESALSVDNPQVTILGQGTLPESEWINFGQPWPVEKNFRWARAEGGVSFFGVNADGAFLELSDGGAQMQVHVLHWDDEASPNFRHLPVRVEGVYEVGHDQNGALAPGVITVPSEKFISLIEPASSNHPPLMAVQPLKPALTNANPGMQGFYSTRGVVTFNDRVLGQDCLFIQENNAAISVSLKGRHFENHLKIGQWLELGGAFGPGKNIPIVDPLTVNELGWRPMPDPITQPIQFPVSAARDGRWTEVEGLVRSVNADGTLSIFGKGGQIYFWVGQTPSNYPAAWVDARLRLRGVLSLTMLDLPLLLVPSRAYVEVEEAAPKDPFAIPISPIDKLLSSPAEYSLAHRARVLGEVIYCRGRSIFIQDSTGGIRIQAKENPGVAIGGVVEAAGFPSPGGAGAVLTEALLRISDKVQNIKPKKLDMTEALSPKQSGTLVQVAATLLDQKTNGPARLLELEEHQRIFTATLPASQNDLPAIISGSRVQVTGIYDDGANAFPASGKPAVEPASAGSLNILLRSPGDVVILNGPPWWNLKRTVTLVGTLLTVLVVTLLWVYLLRRRLHRQQTARLAFSRQILQGQESERQRIAVNLHDSLGQNLLVIKNQARLATQPTSDEADRQNRLNKISEITSQAIEDVRQITHDLRPYQLDRLGLTQAIRAIVNQTSENTPILIAIYLDTIDGIFDKESEIHVYRIVQEALNNILKHSSATEAAVVVKSLPDLVSLSIRDNGRGFDKDKPGSSSVRDIGYGLSGMKERTRILGGKFAIDSQPAQGTSITIEIPKPISKP